MCYLRVALQRSEVNKAFLRKTEHDSATTTSALNPPLTIDPEPLAGSIPLFSRRNLTISLLIGLCCLVVYNANRRAITAGDTYPARYLPFAILHHHTVVLDPIAAITAQGHDHPYWMVQVPAGGHVISLYPVVIPLLTTPLYIPAVMYIDVHGWTAWRLDFIARVMEKLSASLIAALSASLLYLLLRRRVDERVSLLLTFAYAFGTTTWVISSQALWQHGMAELLVIGTLLSLTGAFSAPRAIAAGFLCGLIAANRPPDAILAAALGVYALLWAGRRVWLFAAAAAIPIGLALFYNLTVAHNIAGGYGLRGKAAFFEHSMLSGIAGLLFSPTRGLLVFSPFLFFVVLAWRYWPRDRGERALLLLMSAAIVVQVLIYSKTDWRAGSSWGPRFLTDVQPMFVWLLAPVVSRLRGSGRICFLIAIGVAIAIEAIGAFCYTGATDAAIFAASEGPEAMKPAWRWRNAPFIAALKDGLAPAELMIRTSGSFDVIDARGRVTSNVDAGQYVIASGSAEAGGKAPFQVGVMVDGKNPVASSPSLTWRIPIGAGDLTPGEHKLTALAWISARGEGRYLGDRKLVVREIRGTFDAILSEQRKVSVVNAGDHAVAAGWALAGHDTPSSVSLRVDGRPLITSRTFVNRPDVSAALHETSPSGWLIPIDTASLAPGEHRLTVFARSTVDGDDHLIGEQSLTVTSPGKAAVTDLRAAYDTAVTRVRANQQRDGYWLTSFTSAPRFEQPHPEMNTFLTALMIDLLDPLAATNNLAGTLQRGRAHLTAQIEHDGLVRYHGRPDGPGIGTLGCAITPDSDDTALAWRLAPGADRKQLASALDVMRRYRTPEGLYRTWLAPAHAYQCIDPGSDPDPADIAIQMHVLLLLAKADPQAARALCTALQPLVDQDRIWVYYRMTPLVPMLRVADLQRAGCKLELPASRTRATAQSQDIWVSVVRLLGHAGDKQHSSADNAEARALLNKLASSDFALLRKSPPLLYHNDLTATVHRFYWSEDAGYALWMRLYYEYVGHRNLAG